MELIVGEVNRLCGSVQTVAAAASRVSPWMVPCAGGPVSFATCSVPIKYNI